MSQHSQNVADLTKIRANLLLYFFAKANEKKKTAAMILTTPREFQYLKLKFSPKKERQEMTTLKVLD